MSTNASLSSPAVCNNASLAVSGYNACPLGHNVRLNNIFPEGPEPPTLPLSGSTAWQTTIDSAGTPPTSVVLHDTVLSDVTTNSNVVWGTDNNVPTTGAFATALKQCVASSTTNTINVTTVGCRIRFSVPRLKGGRPSA